MDLFTFDPLCPIDEEQLATFKYQLYNSFEMIGIEYNKIKAILSGLIWTPLLLSCCNPSDNMQYFLSWLFWFIKHCNLIRIIIGCNMQEFKILVLSFMDNGTLEKRSCQNCFDFDLMQRINILSNITTRRTRITLFGR
ncbi:hypothetical protein IEQ34_008998 [Dendrobium chrysotoxum]|uniref:Uncharacterized protein n=1 Tax=Dendrobium chrysotoxum TaxID=161865 RepID=A0AAV7H1J9_DENCH|nr:hypothetical protein IEQ34_008998 [Dendrobium chrysotoxum]